MKKMIKKFTDLEGKTISGVYAQEGYMSIILGDEAALVRTYEDDDGIIVYTLSSDILNLNGFDALDLCLIDDSEIEEFDLKYKEYREQQERKEYERLSMEVALIIDDKDISINYLNQGSRSKYVGSRKDARYILIQEGFIPLYTCRDDGYIQLWRKL